ncbi:11672_t:CDS:2 [Acaulospora colombiana]|uniref:11672_t:CDS:1 n=1 Tax=Acaulospora colombiana TaxID=27376 RepID=A0ACA9NNR2_9GLOM|nr:11672_t:CDS:2 [Acaulospora colombiana]
MVGQPFIQAPDRKRSLIVDVNPIMDKDAFYTPRELPPVLPSHSRQKERVNGRRLMTPVEVEAMASPYDLMIRFGGVQDPDTKQKYLMPNNIEHPKFSKRVGGKNFWISCWKEAVRQTMITGKHWMAIPQLETHGLLLEQVEQMLQQRLIQELEILLTRLNHSRHLVGSQQETIIRRLTREELHDLEHIGTLSLQGVSAIIIEDRSQTLPSPAWKLIRDTFAVGGNLLEAEANIDAKALDAQIFKGDDNTANAYIVSSTSNTIARVDSVPLLIALWRLRLWAGQGWNGGLWGDWEKKSFA